MTEPLANTDSHRRELGNALSQCDTLCPSLRTSINEAQIALAATREAVTGADSPDSEETYNTLRMQLKQEEESRACIRDLTSSLVLASLPTELLQAIFVRVLEAYDAVPVPVALADYNRPRSQAPFVLSSVCRRWRAVALNTPELWTYVALPLCNWLNQPTSVRPLDGVLDRSGGRPLTVLLRSESIFHALTLWTIPVVSPVLAAFSRWERARVDLPTHMADSKYAFLQQRSCILLELYLEWAPDARNDIPYRWTPPRVLSDLPTVRILHTPASLLVGTCTPSSLSSLSISVSASDVAHILGAVRHAPLLCELKITPANETWWAPTLTGAPPPPSGQSICLPWLSSLLLGGYTPPVHALLAALEMPALRALTLESEPSLHGALAQDTPLLALLRAKCAAVERLEFSEPPPAVDTWSARDILHLTHDPGAFPALRHLTLAGCAFAGLWRPLGSRVPAAAAPRLETLTLLGKGRAYTLCDLVEFTAFLAWSGLALGDLRDPYADLPGPRFQLYVRELSPVPPWLPLALGRAVGPENCHVFESDGRQLPAVQDDVDEACFTDGDESCETSSSASSGTDYDDESGPLVTVHGPDWASDESGDSDWCPDESTNSDWYSDSGTRED